MSLKRTPLGKIGLTQGIIAHNQAAATVIKDSTESHGQPNLNQADCHDDIACMRLQTTRPALPE